jgi:hypothetical protein
MAEREISRIRRPKEWLPIPGYEGLYSVTRDGRVWAHQRIEQAPADRRRDAFQRVYKAKWLKPSPMGEYIGVHLYKTKQRKNFYIHHLVMMVWGPPRPSPEHEINHIDLNKRNCHIDNLEWLTRPQNIQHAITHGSNMVAGKLGSDVHNAKLTETQVLEIRRRYTGRRGELTVLGHEFGISPKYVWAIVNRITWKHI